MPTDPIEQLEWLGRMPVPRPFVWQAFVFQRRALYGVLCVLLLLAAVGVPLYWGLQQIGDSASWQRLRPNQIALYFGALIVVAFARFLHSIFKQYDDAKWLLRKGTLTEANLLSVLGSSRRMLVTYRFWDNQGREREKETMIDLDSRDALPNLSAGDVVPLLYDPDKPEQRNTLWVESIKYMKLDTTQRVESVAAR